MFFPQKFDRADNIVTKRGRSDLTSTISGSFFRSACRHCSDDENTNHRSAIYKTKSIPQLKRHIREDAPLWLSVLVRVSLWQTKNEGCCRMTGRRRLLRFGDEVSAAVTGFQISFHVLWDVGQGDNWAITASGILLLTPNCRDKVADTVDFQTNGTRCMGSLYRMVCAIVALHFILEVYVNVSAGCSFKFIYYTQHHSAVITHFRPQTVLTNDLLINWWK